MGAKLLVKQSRPLAPHPPGDGTLTSDDELAEVGDGGAQRGEGDAAVEVLLAALRLHVERRHQPLVAEVSQGGSVQHGTVPPLRWPDHKERYQCAE